MTEGDDSWAGTFEGQTYRHFQSADATTVYVLGEFPWRVRVGDRARVVDYMAPPWLLSSESTEGETTWSLGRYATGEEIREMFGLPTGLPDAVGPFANQPSPYEGRPRRYWTAFAPLFALLAVVFLTRELIMWSGEVVFSGSYQFNPAAQSEPSFVTPTFPIKAPGTLEVGLQTNLRNNWVFLDMALIDTNTGQALDFGREVSYYYGTDSDGPWTEGAQRSTFTLPAIDAGDYYLRVQPEGPAPVDYSIAIRRDVPTVIPYGIALALLLIPPGLVSLRSWSFERARWAESDHAPVSRGDDDDDDGDN
jgi:hypothetical protein